PPCGLCTCPFFFRPDGGFLFLNKSYYSRLAFMTEESDSLPYPICLPRKLAALCTTFCSSSPNFFFSSLFRRITEPITSPSQMIGQIAWSQYSPISAVIRMNPCRSDLASTWLRS